jgi:hypothetical protein
VFICHLDHKRSRKFCRLQVKYGNLSGNVHVNDNGKIQELSENRIVTVNMQNIATCLEN